MTEHSFWSILELLPHDRPRGTELVERLVVLPLEEIVEFRVLLKRFVVRACTVPMLMANYVLRGYLSDDEFEEFRVWVVAAGQEKFERAIENPETLGEWVVASRLENWDAVDILLAARRAGELSGSEASFHESVFSHADYVHDPKLQGVEVNESSVREALPELFAKYWRGDALSEDLRPL